MRGEHTEYRRIMELKEETMEALAPKAMTESKRRPDIQHIFL